MSRQARRLYVETTIRAPLSTVWARTQDPVQHVRWDGRFTAITPVDEVAFTYTLTLPGRTLAGTGTSVGERHRPDGTATSALRFASDDRLSPIRSGSGFWRYEPRGDRVRFLTGYDYAPGPQGRRVDAALVRPAIGWLTAWSFDRLRIWCEGGPAPEVLLRRTLAVTIVRAGLVATGLRGPRVLLLVAAVPSPLTVPRARRCLRRPPRAADTRPPATLAALRTPERTR